MFCHILLLIYMKHLSEYIVEMSKDTLEAPDIVVNGMTISSDVLNVCFECDLKRCKGCCCSSGSEGAVLKEEEVETIEKILPEVQKRLLEEALQKIEESGATYQEDGTTIDIIYNKIVPAWVEKMGYVIDYDNNEVYEYTAINYLQTNYNDMVLLLIGCSNSNVICIDSRTNSELFIFNNININKKINFIISNCDMLCFVSDNKIKYCTLSNIPKQCNSIQNYFNYMNMNEIFFDSEIQCINYSLIKGTDLLLITSKSNLYYANIIENASIKLYSFINSSNHIINVRVIKKNIIMHLIKIMKKKMMSII